MFIIITLGILAFIDALIEKYNAYDKIGLWASRQGSKFLYKAGNCKLCISFYLSIVLVLIMSVAYGFEWVNIFYIFVIVGLFNLFKNK